MVDGEVNKNQIQIWYGHNDGQLTIITVEEAKQLVTLLTEKLKNAGLT